MKKAVGLLSAMLAAVILAASIGPASAAGSTVAYNQVGVRFFDEQKIKAGEMFTAPNGQRFHPASPILTPQAVKQPTSPFVRLRKCWTPISAGTVNLETLRLRATRNPPRQSPLPRTHGRLLNRPHQKGIQPRDGNLDRLLDPLKRLTRNPLKM